MKLSDETFNTLISELAKTPLVNEQELYERTSLVAEFKRVEERKSIILKSDLDHYSFRNDNLNKIITDLTKKNIKDAISLHLITSVPPRETKPHLDGHAVCTLVILLEDDFEGGDFYLNEKKTNLLKTKGEYVIYNGGIERHAVTKITKGIRKTLIVWYGKTKELI